jgi:hypothetical protein
METIVDYKDIQFEHKLCSDKYIKVRRRLAYFFMSTPVLCLCLFVVLASPSAGVVLGLIVMTALISLIGIFAAEIPVDEKEGADCDLGWEWLAARYCNDLLDLCQKYSDLNDYRLRVITEGRQFTWYEYVAMKKWPEQKRKIQANLLEKRNHEAMCKALYES